MPSKCIQKVVLKTYFIIYLTESKALYCRKHKKENMIDIKNKRCIETNCINNLLYNLPTEKKALYCNIHKKENMIDIKSKRCIETNCMTIPTI